MPYMQLFRPYIRTSVEMFKHKNHLKDKLQANEMKGCRFLIQLALPLIISITFNHSHAKQTHPPISNILTSQFHSFNQTHQWRIHQTQFLDTQLKISASTVLAGLFCFIAASISSAGGIGGGGLFIPILTIVAGLDLKTASSFSAFMVSGGSIANVICSLLTTSLRFGHKTLIDYDIALLSEPCMLLGVSVGVICNLVFPEWLITILFAVFLAWSTFKTCKNGVLYWKLESEEVQRNGFEKLDDGNRGVKSSKDAILGMEGNCELRFPWMKFGVLVLIWFSFFLVYLLRGNKYGQSIILIEPCGVKYWIISSFQIPLALVFTTWILYRKKNLRHKTPNEQDMENLTRGVQANKLIFPIMALLAGILGGVYGVGGGMLISPLLIQVGIEPEVTAATCSFMVFFSSTMSAIQYLMLGMEHTNTALIFAIVCFVAALVGLMVVQKAIQKYGRASLIVFSVSIVMGLSTVLMTSFGSLDVWRNYTSGKYMGFKFPC